MARERNLLLDDLQQMKLQVLKGIFDADPVTGNCTLRLQSPLPIRENFQPTAYSNAFMPEPEEPLYETLQKFEIKRNLNGHQKMQIYQNEAVEVIHFHINDKEKISTLDKALIPLQKEFESELKAKATQAAQLERVRNEFSQRKPEILENPNLKRNEKQKEVVSILTAELKNLKAPNKIGSLFNYAFGDKKEKDKIRSQIQLYKDRKNFLREAIQECKQNKFDDGDFLAKGKRRKLGDQWVDTIDDKVCVAFSRPKLKQ